MLNFVNWYGSIGMRFLRDRTKTVLCFNQYYNIDVITESENETKVHLVQLFM